MNKLQLVEGNFNPQNNLNANEGVYSTPHLTSKWRPSFSTPVSTGVFYFWPPVFGPPFQDICASFIQMEYLLNYGTKQPY